MHVYQIKLKTQKGKKNYTPSPTPGPTATRIGGDPVKYVAYTSQNERCLEGGRVAPFQSTSTEKRVKVASSVDTVEGCYTYCSLYGGVPAIFHFYFDTSANQCHCCGEVCTLVWAPQSTVYQVITAATTAPTNVPSMRPTDRKFLYIHAFTQTHTHCTSYLLHGMQMARKWHADGREVVDTQTE